MDGLQRFEACFLGFQGFGLRVMYNLPYSEALNPEPCRGVSQGLGSIAVSCIGQKRPPWADLSDKVFCLSRLRANPKP